MSGGHRRGLCVAAAALAAAVGGCEGDDDCTEGVEGTALDGVVATCGHFETVDGEVTLAEGETATSFDVTAGIPGWDTEDGPSEAILFVHGAVSDPVEELDEVATHLRDAGYASPIIGFAYGSADNLAEAAAPELRERQQEIDRRNRRKLARFLREYAEGAPDTTLHVVAHSGGGFVSLETVRFLEEEGWQGTLDSLVLLSAAVARRTLDVNGRYGPAVEARVTDAHNFYYPGDSVLLGWNALHAGLAIGRGEVASCNPEGDDDEACTPPSNLTEHEVDLEAHDAYWKSPSDGGAVDQILAALPEP